MFALICGVSALLPVVALYLIGRGATGGYEVSIYTSNVPVIAWVMVIAGLAFSVCLIIFEVTREGNRWLFALGALMVCGISVLLLPIVKGYFASSTGDVLMHIGYIRDNLAGTFAFNDDDPGMNVYPMLHLIPVLLTLVGVSAEKAVNLLPILFYIIYVVSFHFLAKELFAERAKVILITTFSALLMLPNCGVVAATYPSALVLPLVLLLLVRVWRRFTWWNVVALLIATGLVAMIHPLASEFILVSATVGCMVRYKRKNKLLTLLSLLVVMVPIAVWYFTKFEIVFLTGCCKEIIVNLTNIQISQTIALPTTLVDTAFVEAQSDTSSTPWIFSLIVLILKRYGGEFILCVLSVVAILLLAKRRIKKQEVDSWAIYFGALFIVVNVMWFMGWCFGEKHCSQILERAMYWVPMIAILLSVPLLTFFIRKWKIERLVLVALLIIVVGVLSVFNTYPAPFTSLPHNMTTYHEINGIKWLIDQEEDGRYVILLGQTTMDRYASAIYGRVWYYNNMYRNTWLTQIPEPDGKPYYIVVSKRDKMQGKTFVNSESTLVYKDGDELEIWFVPE